MCNGELIPQADFGSLSGLRVSSLDGAPESAWAHALTQYASSCPVASSCPQYQLRNNSPPHQYQCRPAAIAAIHKVLSEPAWDLSPRVSSRSRAPSADEATEDTARSSRAPGSHPLEWISRRARPKKRTTGRLLIRPVGLVLNVARVRSRDPVLAYRKTSEPSLRRCQRGR